MRRHQAVNLKLHLCLRISHPIINGRETRYNICDCIKQRLAEWKGALLSTKNMGKGLHKVFKAVVNELSQALPILGESV